MPTSPKKPLLTIRNKQELYDLLDEWLDNRLPKEPEPTKPALGMEFDLESIVGSYPSGRMSNGPRVQELLQALPTRVLFQTHGFQIQKELDILEFNRKVIESNPKWMTNHMAGQSATFVTWAQNPDGTIRDDILVRPSINGRMPTLRQVQTEVSRWIKNKLHLAYMQDNDPTRSQDS